jgi:tRNA threonylcarbamoyladenosine biosynthesis protein TsaE
LNFISYSEKNTRALGKKSGEVLRGGEIFLLVGDLGGGKTQFTKGLAEGLGITEPVTSPTFNYENIYQGERLKLYHYDLYRNDEIDNDIRDLMLESFSDKGGVTVVEWAERARLHWPKGATLVEFDWIDENTREIKIKKINGRKNL